MRETASQILNVAIANTTAIGIYRRLGFRFHCRFWEGHGQRKERTA